MNTTPYTRIYRRFLFLIALLSCGLTSFFSYAYLANATTSTKNTGALPSPILVSPNMLAPAMTTTSIDAFEAKPPIHVLTGSSTSPQGMTPAQIKKVYNLPSTGGSGTIAIISAYQHKIIAADLATFDKKFALTGCTVENKCLEIHPMSSTTPSDSNNGWGLESALDTEWAHAIAPKAKILLIEATTPHLKDLMQAVAYAKSRAGVVSISMSWGGAEFPDEVIEDKYFASSSIVFFASSGDDGAGASWPAVSPNVIAVGGTSLIINKDSGTNTQNSGLAFLSEKAWSGSGGGISKYETEPEYQKIYSIPQAEGKRAIPDVSYAADPAYGFSVYHDNRWYVVGGTSAGAPQWAAIEALGKSVSLTNLYADKASDVYATYFRDIVSGKNGTCAYYCQARARYDYVTGLGSPITDKF